MDIKNIFNRIISNNGKNNDLDQKFDIYNGDVVNDIDKNDIKRSNIININVEVSKRPINCKGCYFKRFSICDLYYLKNNKRINCKKVYNKNICPLNCIILDEKYKKDEITFNNLKSYLVNTKDNVYQLMLTNNYGCFNETVGTITKSESFDDSKS